MLVVCTPVLDEAICRRAAYNGTSKFVRVTIDPATKHLLNLPADYKYHSVFLPHKYQRWADRLHNFEVREDDIWICGFPKTGTTWLHNIAWQLTNNLNFGAPPKGVIEDYFEAPIIRENDDGDEKLKLLIEECDQRLDQYDTMASPRIFKTHLPAFLLPKQIWTSKSKVIAIARHPTDSIISMYHMRRNLFPEFEQNEEYLLEAFISGESIFCPFFDHINSFWQLRHLDHVLITTYEKLSADLFSGVKQICAFLQCSYNDEQLKQLAEHVSFKNMNARPPKYLRGSDERKDGSEYNHCRKGKVGGYLDDLSPEWIKRFDDWIEKNLKKTDFRFL